MWLRMMANFLKVWFYYERASTQDGVSLLDVLVKEGYLKLSDIHPRAVSVLHEVKKDV